jgi:methanogenic corrinoid protein MtbC1
LFTLPRAGDQIATVTRERDPGRRDPGLLSIGALSAATGIPITTIRTWERRYGYPIAERKPSGHRVYPLSAVPRLRRVTAALARGYRAAEVVPATEAVLDSLLEALGPPPTARPQASAVAVVQHAAAGVGDLLAAALAFDHEGLKRALHADWARLGPLPFLEQRVAPFLQAVGDGWAKGELEVRHEHFASACVGDFLRLVRIPLDDRAEGPIVALATLPGERHGIGLLMAGLVFALAGWRVLDLGVDTPPDQIVALAREAPLRAVALSLVKTRNGRSPAAATAELRQALPRRVQLLVGGAAAAQRPGVTWFPDLATLDRWLRDDRRSP